MKATRVLVLTLVFAICGLLFWQWVNRPPDPIYAGKPLSYWFTREISIPPNFQGRPEFDSNAVPYFISQILKSTPIQEKCYRILSPKMPRIVKVFHLEPAIPTTRRRSLAAAKLAHLAREIDRKNMSLLVAELENSDPEIRARVSGVISAGYRSVTNGLQLLETCFQHKDLGVRAQAMMMVPVLPRNDKILSMITNNTRVSDARCKDAAVQLIERIADPKMNYLIDL